MLADPARLRAALGLPADAELDAEPLTGRPGGPERLAVAGYPAAFLLCDASDESGANNFAVLEALAAVGFERAPSPAAFVDGIGVETFVDGLPLLAIEPSAGQLELAVDALAALHQLSVREGLRWELAPPDQLPADLPLHRLGFGAAERGAAAPAISAAREALIASPTGFVHGAATANHLLLRRDDVALVDFAAAGFGLQLFDLAALLLTSGADAPTRRALAVRYGRLTGLACAVEDVADLAALWWGLEWQIGLPRRLIATLGDDAAGSALRLMSRRVELAVLTPAGDHPAAAAIRAALWGS